MSLFCGADDASTTHRILCYGDSLTAGTSTSPFDLYPFAPYLEQELNKKGIKSVVRHRGMPGWTADAMLDAADDPQYGLRSAIQRIQNPSLSCVIIMAGTNDLGYAFGKPEDERISTVLNPVKALHEMAWEAGVPKTMAIAIPPSGYQSQVSEAAKMARHVNQQLEQFCQESKSKAFYVPFPFEYEISGENWCDDGLHFSPEGYQVLGKYLADPVIIQLNGSKFS